MNLSDSVDPKRIQKLVAERDVHALEATLVRLADANGNCKPAVVALIEIGTNPAWDAIGRFLAQKQTAVVSFTIADLEEVEKAGAARALGASLSNASATIRRAAVRALARQEPVNSLAHLLRASRDPDHDVAAAARALIVQQMNGDPGRLDGVPERVLDGAFGLVDARRPFDLIEEGHPENVRVVAARRLAAVADDEAAEIFVNVIAAEEGRVVDACWGGLERCRELRDSQLLSLLTHEHPAVVERAVRIFARVAGPEHAGTFAALTRDPSADVRKAALAGLARVGGQDHVQAIANSLHDAEEVRRLAADLLGELDESTPFLLAAVDHRDTEVRKIALTHLAQRSVLSDHLMPRYFEFLSGGADCTRQSDQRYIDSLAAVARAIGKANMKAGLRPLSHLARSALRRLRRAAIESLMEYEATQRAATLYALADTWDQDVLRNVAFGLWEADDLRAVVPMIRVAREARGAVVKRARQSLNEISELADCDVLIRLLREPYPSVRRFAAEQLLGIRNPRSVPALLAVSRDDDVEVQLAVFEALAPFAADHRDVTDRMLEAIGYGDVSVRQAACEALGEARCEAAVPDLVRALHNCFLRPRATEALKRIGDRMGILAIKRLERRERMFKRKPPRGASLSRKRARAV